MWSFNKSEEIYKPVVLSGHSSNVNIVDGVYKDAEKGSVVVVTISVDSTAIIWFRSDFKGILYSYLHFAMATSSSMKHF